MFESLTGVNANASAFFANVLENVDWTIEGTHPLAGQYHNRTILEAAFARIDATGAEGSPLVLSLIDVIGGGDEQYSVQELQVLGTCIDGSICLTINNPFTELINSRACVQQPLCLGDALEHRRQDYTS